MGFEVGAEAVVGGCLVERIDVHSPVEPAGMEDLGEIAVTSLDESRREVVLETTGEDARRVRQIPGVRHISQRKVGEKGRVRITVDAPENDIADATSQTNIWAPANLRATDGILLYQSKVQWDELATLLQNQTWAGGHRWR